MSSIADRNPFVGPRPIQQGEAIHGRQVEIRELFDRLQARRIVVLHSPSGAGKSSLVQAGLIPRLQAARFDVWKPIRVNFDPSRVEGRAPDTNRYLLSAMVSLEEELPASHRRAPAELSALSFGEYLAARPRRKGRAGLPVVLIFDQFEEVLTVGPRAVEEKIAFFQAVGEALETGAYWALFVLREDYLGALAPYRTYVPTQLANTFRLDLLGLAGAKEAAVELARSGGRSFPAVDQLIADLSRVSVQRPDGSFESEAGHHVEPVHLQVVCRRLWEEMPAEHLAIGTEDLARYAEVSKALGAFYAHAMHRIAAGSLAVERSLREWVGARLIVGGIRSQVRQEAGHSAGLDNVLIQRLLESYLVRSEQRAGAIWFELSHDRLVEAVQLDNLAWEQAHLHPMQVQARLWEEGKRSRGLLLNVETLGAATAWAEENSELLTESEQDFLADSASVQREIKRNQRLRLLVVLFLGLGAIFASTQWAVAVKLRAEASDRLAHFMEEQGRIALVEQGDTRRAVVYLAESYKEAPDRLIARGLLARALTLGANEEIAALTAHQRQVLSVAFSPDGQELLTASEDATAMVWNAKTGAHLFTLTGHLQRVWTAVFSSDGKFIVTASDDDTARIWNAGTTVDPKTDTEVDPNVFTRVANQTLVGHTGGIWTARFSPNDALVVTSSFDTTARVWDAQTGAVVAVLKGHGGPVEDARFSPDGDRVVTASRDNTARIWSARSGAQLQVLSGHEDSVHTASFSPDGQLVLTASADMTVRLWDAESGDQEALVTQHNDGVWGAEFSPDGSRIASASDDGTSVLWDVHNRVPVAKLTGRGGQVYTAAFSADGSRVVTASADHLARVWDTGTGALLTLLAGHSGQVLDARFSPDGREVATASVDGTARLWRVTAGSPPHALEGHAEQVLAMDYSPDGDRVVTAGADKVAILWDPHKGAQLARLEGHTGAIRSARFSPSGDRVLTASADGTARLWSATSGDRSQELAAEDGPLVDAVLSANGQRVLTLGEGGGARVWDVASGVSTNVISGPAEPLFAGMFSPDGRRVVIGGQTVRIWNLAANKEFASLKGHDGAILSLAQSPDGKQLITGGADQTARTWDAQTGAPSLVLRGHGGKILGVAFSPDGERVVTACDDQTAKVWSTADGELLATLTGHEGAVVSAVFGPDGGRVLTTSRDGTARLWSASSGGLLDTPMGQSDAGPRARFSPNGSQVLTNSNARTVLTWDAHLELRPPEEIENEVRCRIPFKIQDFMLVSATPDPSLCMRDP